MTTRETIHHCFDGLEHKKAEVFSDGHNEIVD